MQKNHRSNGNNRPRPKAKDPQKKPKKRSKLSRIKWDYILALACIIAAAIFFGDSIFESAKKQQIETDIIGFGKVESSAQKKMVVVRNEKVLKAPSDGYYELIYPEGEKVKKGLPVAKSKNQESAENYNYLIELLDSRINNLSNGKSAEFEKDDLNKINNRLEYLYRSAQGRLQSGDIEYIEKIKKEIISLNDKKQYFYPNEAMVSKEALIAEKERLIQEKNNKNSTVYANMIGLVSSYYDGYESELSILNLKNLSVTMLDKIQNAANIDYSATIQKGEPVAVIAENFKWYLVGEITKEDIDYIVSEAPIYIEIEDKRVLAYLENFYKGSDGKFVGYFRVEDEIFKFYEKRKYDANIIFQSSDGLAIPLSAVTEYEGKTGVFVVERTGVARFKETPDIAARDQKFAGIPYDSYMVRDVNKVNLYDEVVLNPENVREGQRVK